MLFNSDIDDRVRILKYVGGISYNINLMERSLVRLAFCIGEDNIESGIVTTYDLKSEYNGPIDKQSRADLIEDLVKVFEYFHTAEDNLEIVYTKVSLGVEDYSKDILEDLDKVLLSLGNGISYIREHIATHPIYTRNEDLTSDKIVTLCDTWGNLNTDNLAYVEKINDIMRAYLEEEENDE